MTNIILYPTETLYALGVNALDRKALDVLYKLKGREPSRTSSWLVRGITDIERYAELSDTARMVAERFLPGSLTLVLPTKEDVPRDVIAADGTVGFRVTTDPSALELIDAYMAERDAPLTCTSANVSGSPVFPTVGEILQQFGRKAEHITQIVDDGPRKGLASTVVRVIGDEVTVIREGEISEREIREAIA